MDVPDGLRYTAEHEWLAVGEDGTVRLGITDYAQDALGDVVFVQLPVVGLVVEPGAILAEVESTKSVAEVYAPVAGTVSGINSELTDRPELVNQSPYEGGWFAELKVADPDALQGLLDADAYRSLIG
ncbi:MAG TPA: glycine cleavage system protein GcvH [Acidimicrobiia bacterium]|jgi:glycine cleavage system H protein